MVSPTELNVPGIEADFPDYMTPMPLDKPLGSTDMPPPPMIQIDPLALNSIWDSDMMTKYTNNVTGKRSGTAAIVDMSGLNIMPLRH